MIGLLATTKKNAQATWDLRQELAGCTALKETVDDIKTHQLNRIWDNIKNVATDVTDIMTKYANLDSKHSEAFDAVNTRVDDILREGIPPAPAQATDSPSSPPADGASMPTPANVVPTSAPQREGRLGLVESEDVPRSDAPAMCAGTRTVRQSDGPDLPGAQDFRDTGGSTLVRWRPQLNPRRSPCPHDTGQHETPNSADYCGATRPVSNPYHGSRDTWNESARLDPRRYTAHVPPHSRRPQEVDVDYDLDDETHLP